MVWGGEVDARTGLVFDSGVGVEFGAFVGGDGFDRVPLSLDERDNFSIELVGSARAQLADNDVFGHTFDQGDDAVPAMSAHDGVRFPMAEAGAVVRARRALGDLALIGKYSPEIGAPVAFPALLRGLAQALVKAPPVAAVVPDVAVNGLMADIEDPVEAQPAGDLLGTPVGRGSDALHLLCESAPPDMALRRTRISVGCFPWRSVRDAELGSWMQ